MSTGNPGAVGNAAMSAPSKGAGELASLLAEVKSMTPEHLRKIEAQVAEFHLAQEAAEKAQRDAEQAQREAELAQQELGKREHSHNEGMGRDLDNLNHREVGVKRREDNVEVREVAVKTREDEVATAERSINRVRKQLGPAEAVQ